jgi:hypothetical protein
MKDQDNGRKKWTPLSQGMTKMDIPGIKGMNPFKCHMVQNLNPDF